MKFIKGLMLSFSLLVIGNNAMATYGCYIASPNGRIYTSLQGGSGKWRSSPFENIGTNACLSGGGSGPSCEVSGVGFGVLGDYSFWYCPIDDYVWVLMIISSILAIGVIQKRLYISLIKV